MPRAALFALLVLVPSVATAGDPCPIEFTLYDLGAAPGSDRDALLGGLQSKDAHLGLGCFSTDRGVVAAPDTGGPAAAAGVQQGDVVLSVAGHAVSKADEAQALFDQARPGDPLAVTVQRAGANLDLTVMVGQDDPFVQALLDFAGKQECTGIRRGKLNPGQREAVLEVLFHPENGFRCRRAHDRLDGFGGGDVFFLRDRERILLVHAGWETECVAASDYDGEKLTEARLEKLFHKLVKGFVDDQHANP